MKTQAKDPILSLTGVYRKVVPITNENTCLKYSHQHFLSLFLGFGCLGGGGLGFDSLPTFYSLVFLLDMAKLIRNPNRTTRTHTQRNIRNKFTRKWIQNLNWPDLKFSTKLFNFAWQAYWVKNSWPKIDPNQSSSNPKTDPTRNVT